MMMMALLLVAVDDGVLVAAVVTVDGDVEVAVAVVLAAVGVMLTKNSLLTPEYDLR